MVYLNGATRRPKRHRRQQVWLFWGALGVSSLMKSSARVTPATFMVVAQVLGEEALRRRVALPF